jgi:Brp/Blh family beta-carotene 15,15'-monooxygenase
MIVLIMNFKKTAVFITLISLWLSNYFNEPSQQILAFFLIFSVGILHGSNDLAIINKLKSTKSLKQITLLFGSYVVTVVLAAALFYKFPFVALAAFILFSGYHFGEQHWSDLVFVPNGLMKLLFTAYGLAVLSLLFFLNGPETLEIISLLTSRNDFSEIWFLYGMTGCFGITIILLGTLLVKKQIAVSRLLFELFLFLVFAIVFKYASLIWAFAIYFIFWHSIPSILEQLKYLYGDASTAAFKKYLRSSAIIWFISIGFIFLMLYLVKDDMQLFVPLFFAFLGAITFAHSFIITKMFSANK